MEFGPKSLSFAIFITSRDFASVLSRQARRESTSARGKKNIGMDRPHQIGQAVANGGC